MENIARFLQRLVRVRSTPEHGTEKVNGVIAREAGKLGMDYGFFGPNMIITNFPEKRFCRRYGREFLFVAHSDTVPEGVGWKGKPFSGKIVGGRIYGRGALDDKSGIAAALYGLALSENNAVLAVTADEEIADRNNRGINFLVKRGLRARGALACEPLSDKIDAGCRGLLRETVTFRAPGGHTGRATKERDAIEMAAEFALGIRRLRYPRLHPFKPSAGRVTITGGGEGIAMLPSKCEVSYDFRITPNTAVSRVQRDVHALAKKAGTPAFKTIVRRDGFLLGKNERVLRVLQAAGRMVLGRAVPLGVSNPYSDAAVLNNSGTPCAAGFGVDGGNIHGPGEWASLPSLERTARAYALIADLF